MRTKHTRSQLKTMSKNDLVRLVMELENDPEAGFDAGWDAALSHWWVHMQKLNDDFFKLGTAMTYTFGIAAAGFGDTPKIMLKHLSGKIAEAVDWIKSETRAIERITRTKVPMENLVTETDALKDALKAMYADEDKGEKLREIAAKYNPVMADNILRDRLLVRPGAKRQDVLDRLCTKLKRYRDAGLTYADSFDALTAELCQVQQPSNQLREELAWIEDSADPAKALENAYRRRELKST